MTDLQEDSTKSSSEYTTASKDEDAAAAAAAAPGAAFAGWYEMTFINHHQWIKNDISKQWQNLI